MHYNYQRYYDPDTGQYCSPDPIGIAGDLRQQGYVHDPSGWIDPLGLNACGDTKAAWGLTIGQTKRLLTTAKLPKKNTTEVGFALSKHAGRPITHSNPAVSGQQVWGKIKGSMDTWHEQGMRHLREIIRAPGVLEKYLHSERHFFYHPF